MTTEKRSKLMLACTALLLAAMVTGGTLAYFFDQSTKVNNFTTAGTDNPDTGVDVDVEEPNFEVDEAQDALPGDTIMKDPTVVNNRGDVYVRFVMELQEASGATITDETRANKILDMIVYSGGTLDTDTSYSSDQIAGYPTVNEQFELDSTRSSAGKYYYNYIGGTPEGILTNGQKVTLFDFVVVPTDWTQTDIAVVGNFNIVVTAQAIQAENMTDANAAFDALDDEIANAGN